MKERVGKGGASAMDLDGKGRGTGEEAFDIATTLAKAMASLHVPSWSCLLHDTERLRIIDIKRKV